MTPNDHVHRAAANGVDFKNSRCPPLRCNVWLDLCVKISPAMTAALVFCWIVYSKQALAFWATDTPLSNPTNE